MVRMGDTDHASEDSRRTPGMRERDAALCGR